MQETDQLNGRFRAVVLETGRNITRLLINRAGYKLEVTKVVDSCRAYLKMGSLSCEREGVTGELLKRNCIKSHPCSVTTDS